MQGIWLLLTGAAGGVLSGFFGIGGGIVIVPLLLMLGFSAQRATGTSLAALVPPVGFFAALEYYRRGDIRIMDAALVALGIVLGSWATARVALEVPAALARQIFGAFLIVVGARFLFFK